MPTAPRGDFAAPSPRAVARKAKDGGQARRRLALPVVHEGASRTEAARIGDLKARASSFASPVIAKRDLIADDLTPVDMTEMLIFFLAKRSCSYSCLPCCC